MLTQLFRWLTDCDQFGNPMLITVFMLVSNIVVRIVIENFIAFSQTG